VQVLVKYLRFGNLELGFVSLLKKIKKTLFKICGTILALFCILSFNYSTLRAMFGLFTDENINVTIIGYK